MSRTDRSAPALAAKQRVEEGPEALRVGLVPYVKRHMRDRHGPNWRHYASRAHRDEPGGELDIYALLKTLLDQWNDLFRHDAKLRKARSFVSPALDARNSAAHFAGDTGAREALRYLDAMRELLAAAGATPQVAIIEGLYEAERAASGGRSTAAPAALTLEEPPPKEQLRPWREVCEPHPDVLEARFSDAEFAANLALVDQGGGGEEYGDPAAFFRITYATEGLRRVLIATVARLAGRGGEPVIGLQTNFGGGKTHTMLALHHLAGATEAGYPPERLDGMGPIFIVCEGATDIHAIECFLKASLRNRGLDARFVRLQPRMDRTSPSGGWAMVFKWFEQNPSDTRIRTYFDGGLFDHGLSAMQCDVMLFQMVYRGVPQPRVRSGATTGSRSLQCIHDGVA